MKHIADKSYLSSTFICPDHGVLLDVYEFKDLHYKILACCICLKTWKRKLD